MKKQRFFKLQTLRSSMMFLNFINVFFCGSIVLLTTKYIINQNLARDFLVNIPKIPTHPLQVFFFPLLLYVGLVGIMLLRQHRITEETKADFICGLLEIVFCILIIYYSYMGYNGLVFLVFADIISHLKKNRSTGIFLGVLTLVFIFVNYNVFSTQVRMIALEDFIEVYDVTTRTTLFAVKNILESLNLALFILFMVFYISNQREENENISKELSMINQVNAELRNYAKVTEKIGEDRERKRLAREIHDTLGHALTGISAGVDACIAMIDKNPKATKEQLHLVSNVVRQGIKEVRGSLEKLRPGELEQHTFKEAILHMIEEFSKVSDVIVHVIYALENVDFDKTKEDTLFRIIQESITNAKRHGKAKNIYLSLEQKEGNLFLTIQDDGIGCSEIEKGYGLLHMEERVNMLNGEVMFKGENGFLICISIPMRRGEQYD